MLVDCSVEKRFEYPLLLGFEACQFLTNHNLLSGCRADEFLNARIELIDHAREKLWLA
jgi:hypothetical protein